MPSYKRGRIDSEDGATCTSSEDNLNEEDDLIGQDVSNDDIADNGESRVHVPKTKYAIAFGYLGSAYHGYQIQSGPQHESIVTVEGSLLEALVNAGAIHESHRNLWRKLKVSRTSRTDKGVHAACTYMGGRFMLSHLSANEPTIPREEALAAKLNELLPADIRCYRVLRVTRGFCARSMCVKRMYEYLFPSALLKRRYVMDNDWKKQKFDDLTKMMEENLKSQEPISCSLPGSSIDGWKGESTSCEIDLDLLQDILRDYCGSHDFLNFTPQTKSSENTRRFIHEIKVEKRHIAGYSDQAVAIVITGASFLYNQIRKMISLAYEVYIGTAPRNAIKFALHKAHRVQTGIAPAEGLFLRNPYFDAYNKRCNPPQTPMIMFEDIEEMVENFKTTQIYPTIANSFGEEVWSLWLSRILRNPFFLENQYYKLAGDEHVTPTHEGAVVKSDAENVVDATKVPSFSE